MLPLAAHLNCGASSASTLVGYYHVSRVQWISIGDVWLRREDGPYFCREVSSRSASQALDMCSVLVAERSTREIRVKSHSLSRLACSLFSPFDPGSVPSFRNHPLQHTLGLGVEGFLATEEPKVMNLHRWLRLGIVDHRLPHQRDAAHLNRQGIFCRTTTDTPFPATMAVLEREL